MKTDNLRATALAILERSETLSRRAGSFLGQCVADATPLSEKQASWFATLADKAGVAWEGAADGQ